MLSKIEKRRIKKMFYSKAALLILVALLILIARATWDVYKKAEYANDNKARAQLELNELRERENFLNKELAELGSARGREAQLRGGFDVGREGEGLIVLVDVPAPTPTEPAPTKTLWQKIKDFF